MGCSFTPRMTGFDDIDVEEVVVFEETGNRGCVKEANDDAGIGHSLYVIWNR